MDSVRIAPWAGDLPSGKTLQLHALVYAANGASTATRWSVSVQPYAAIDQHGLVTALAIPGAGGADVVVTATSSFDSSKSATARVHVIPPITSVVVRGAPASAIQIGDRIQLSAGVVAAPGFDSAVVWRAATPTILAVDARGLVTALAPGVGRIDAIAVADTAQRGSATVSVAGRVRGVTVTPGSVVLIPGGVQQASAQVAADAGVSTAVAWSSSDPSVATVDGGGKVTGVQPGAATIAARAVADPNFTATMAIVVRPRIPTTVAILAVVMGGGTVPVDLTNVAGTIEFRVRVEGDDAVARAEITIDGSVAAVANAPLTIASAFSVNTASRTTGGAFVYCNGSRSIQARVVLAGSGGVVPGPTLTLRFNNPGAPTC